MPPEGRESGKGRSGADQGDKMGGVHVRQRSWAGLDELECYGQAAYTASQVLG
jgi:hypothetical protein